MRFRQAFKYLLLPLGMVVLFYAKEQGLELPVELTARASVIAAVQPKEALEFLQKNDLRGLVDGYVLGMEMIADDVEDGDMQTELIDELAGKRVFDYLEQIGEVGVKPLLFYSWRVEFGYVFNPGRDGGYKTVEEDLERRVEVAGHPSLVVEWFERNFKGE